MFKSGIKVASNAGCSLIALTFSNTCQKPIALWYPLRVSVLGYNGVNQTPETIAHECQH